MLGASRPSLSVGFTGKGSQVPHDLAAYIDHTLVRPDATAADIDRLCDEAREFGFASSVILL